MTPADLPAVGALAAQLHPGYPEDEAVFAERLALAAEGCLCLEQAGRVCGYVLSHPWLRGRVPALNNLLGALPAMADAYYIHDLALLPAMRGGGHASDCVERIVGVARRHGFACLSLVAVNGSTGFWQRQGFRPVHDPALAAKLASYDDAARYMERELDPDAAGVA